MDSIKASYTNTAELEIQIKATDGVWTYVTAAPAKTLWLDQKDHWGTTADAKNEVKNKDTELISYIADTTSDMKNAYVKVIVGKNCKVLGVVAVEGTNIAPKTMPASTNFTSGKWNGWKGKAGVIEGNIIVGTAPVLVSGS